jgi:hypothetical protein
MEVAEIEELCKRCGLGNLCPEKAKVTVYCLESMLSKTES